MRQNDFDRQFDEALEVAAQKLEAIPDSSNSWEKIRLQTQKINRRKRLKRRLQLSVVIACSILLGAFVFGNPSESKAFFLPFIQLMKALENSVVVFLFGIDQIDKSAKTNPPPDEQNSNGVSGEKKPFHLKKPRIKSVFHSLSFPFWINTRSKK